MTWVVAASTIYGYGALYSDVQVTFKDGHTQDLVQKSYPVGKFIAAGFAGSVRIGFALIQSLHNALEIPRDEDANQVAWDPLFVSVNFPEIARHVFESAPAEERKLGAHVLMVGAAPNENASLGAKIYITRFAHPHFTPRIMTKVSKVCSIGSGAGISEYKRCIKPLFRFPSPILNGEVMNPGGWGEVLGSAISHALNDYPKHGISRHIHMILVNRGSIRIGRNDKNIYRGEERPIEFRMPDVATTYEAFRQLASACGHDAACAAC